MARLSKRSLAQLNKAIESAADPAARMLKAEILAKARELADEDGYIGGDAIAELRRFAIGRMDDIGMAGCELTSAAGAEFYDSLRFEATGRSDFTAEALVEDLHVANNRAVRGMIQKVVKSGKADVFAEECAQRVNAQIRRAPNRAIAHNARRDRLKPKWARIPGDAETCNFCLMLASRGFVYGSEEMASHGHAGCNCRIVPGFGENPQVQGYDPEALYDRWADKGRPMDVTIRGESVPYEKYFGNMDRRGQKRRKSATDKKAEPKDAPGQSKASWADYQRLLALVDGAKDKGGFLAAKSAIERDISKVPKQFVPVLRRKLEKVGKSLGV